MTALPFSFRSTDGRLHRVPLTLDLGRGIITEDDFRAQLEDQGMSSSWVDTELAEVRGAR